MQIGDGGSLGTLTATCNDQAPRAGVEDPTTELNFVNTSGDFINVARRAGIRDDAQYNAIPNGTVAQLVINGSNTFLFHVEYRGRNLLVNGVVRQDGRGSAGRVLPRLGHRPGDRSVTFANAPPGARSLQRRPGRCMNLRLTAEGASQA